jgi:hypothetical protein
MAFALLAKETASKNIFFFEIFGNKFVKRQSM